MITLSNQGDLITICRDGFILLGARPTALPGIIAQATPTTLTYDEAKEALSLIRQRHPETARACLIVRDAIDKQERAQAEIQAVLDNTDALLAAEDYDALPILNLPEEDEEYAADFARLADLGDAFVEEFASDAPEEDDRDAKIAALEAERDTYRAFVEEIIAGEDGWDAGQHVALARIALEARDEAGQAKIAALEAENAALRQRIAEMESKGGGA